MKKLYVLLAWVPTVVVGFPVVLACIFAVIVAERMGWLKHFDEFDECDCADCQTNRSIMSSGRES